MRPLSPAAVVFTFLLSSPAIADSQTYTCDADRLNRESYRLTTDAQAMNVTRPRTNWWDGFDASLRTHQNALGDLNDAALTIAERALDLDPKNQLAHPGRRRFMTWTPERSSSWRSIAQGSGSSASA